MVGNEDAWWSRIGSALLRQSNGGAAPSRLRVGDVINGARISSGCYQACLRQIEDSTYVWLSQANERVSMGMHPSSGVTESDVDKYFKVYKKALGLSARQIRQQLTSAEQTILKNKVVTRVPGSGTRQGGKRNFRMQYFR